jgi:hypothetical protein
LLFIYFPAFYFLFTKDYPNKPLIQLLFRGLRPHASGAIVGHD